MIGKYARLMLETVQVDKFLQTLGEFWHLNFNRQYQELRERADQQIKTAQDRAREQVVSSFRTVFQVNKDRKLLEERLRTATAEFQGKVSALQTMLDQVSAERDQAKGMYGEQFDRASELEERLRNRSVNKVSSRLARMYRATDRSRTPVILFIAYLRDIYLFYSKNLNSLSFIILMYFSVSLKFNSLASVNVITRLL